MNIENTKKMTIMVGEIKGNSFHELASMKVCFNPENYSISESNEHAEAKIPGLGAPIIQYKQGNARELSLELVFDTYLRPAEGKKNLRKDYIEPLEKLLKIDEDTHAPLFCRIGWGDLDFVGVLTKMYKKFTLFTPGGYPVRARVNLTFKEYLVLGNQVKKNPLNSPDKRKRYLVKQGEHIYHLSYRAYNDPAQWRAIAAANKILDPLILVPGSDLIIPVLHARDRR
jgi:nucleoid-associated protein YgaU